MTAARVIHPGLLHTDDIGLPQRNLFLTHITRNLPALFAAKTSFKRRLYFTGISLFVIVILAATALFLAARQHNFYLERRARAQHVYSSYLAVSDHTYRKLSAMGEIVTDGFFFDLEERYRNQKALRDALAKVRESIDAELIHVGDVAETAELDHFNKIETLAEEIILGSEVVRTAVKEDKRTIAKQALDRLRSEEIEGKFNNLIDQALEEELREVRETERVAMELSAFLIKLLPFLAAFFLLFGALLIYATWQALTKSLRVFEQAAESYRAGNFDYRINKVEEAEFSDLADALNHMASEVASQRERERVSLENLESLISARTCELEETNQKLESISETRKQFLADISHELRTPLTIIQGESDMALRGEKKSAEQYIDALGRVKEQAVHTTRLVQDLLFVARTEDGKAPMHRRSVALVPLVQEMCGDFRVLAAERDVEIIETYIDTDLVANVDAGRIKQVVSILLDNAVRYSHKKSKIAVNIRELDQQAILTVTDTGIGLTYHESSQVFSRFYRGNDNAGDTTGTGLGLPVAKAIIDAHGGSINLHGEKDRGTTATVMLPIDTQLRSTL